ncbi:unnamed protein product [Gongylonema pulchrum]|uniref:PH domain-containing protein n=1 Tax=Gongylonema pulchrum TaxID=637853 RepID=A0A183CYQ9_9BILA|nr:unnamed protein product [Gongylonema pulchrum]
MLEEQRKKQSKSLFQQTEKSDDSDASNKKLEMNDDSTLKTLEENADAVLQANILPEINGLKRTGKPCNSRPLTNQFSKTANGTRESERTENNSNDEEENSGSVEENENSDAPDLDLDKSDLVSGEALSNRNTQDAPRNRASQLFKKPTKSDESAAVAETKSDSLEFRDEENIHKESTANHGSLKSITRSDKSYKSSTETSKSELTVSNTARESETPQNNQEPEEFVSKKISGPTIGLYSIMYKSLDNLAAYVLETQPVIRVPQNATAIISRTNEDMSRTAQADKENASTRYIGNNAPALFEKLAARAHSAVELAPTRLQKQLIGIDPTGTAEDRREAWDEEKLNLSGVSRRQENMNEFERLSDEVPEKLPYAAAVNAYSDIIRNRAFKPQNTQILKLANKTEQKKQQNEYYSNRIQQNMTGEVLSEKQYRSNQPPKLRSHQIPEEYQDKTDPFAVENNESQEGSTNKQPPDIAETDKDSLNPNYLHNYGDLENSNYLHNYRNLAEKVQDISKSDHSPQVPCCDPQSRTAAPDMEPIPYGESLKQTVAPDNHPSSSEKRSEDYLRNSTAPPDESAVIPQNRRDSESIPTVTPSNPGQTEQKEEPKGYMGYSDLNTDPGPEDEKHPDSMANNSDSEQILGRGKADENSGTDATSSSAPFTGASVEVKEASHVESKGAYQIKSSSEANVENDGSSENKFLQKENLEYSEIASIRENANVPRNEWISGLPCCEETSEIPHSKLTGNAMIAVEKNGYSYEPESGQNNCLHNAFSPCNLVQTNEQLVNFQNNSALEPKNTKNDEFLKSKEATDDERPTYSSGMANGEAEATAALDVKTSQERKGNYYGETDAVEELKECSESEKLDKTKVTAKENCTKLRQKHNHENQPFVSENLKPSEVAGYESTNADNREERENSIPSLELSGYSASANELEASNTPGNIALSSETITGGGENDKTTDAQGLAETTDEHATAVSEQTALYEGYSDSLKNEEAKPVETVNEKVATTSSQTAVYEVSANSLENKGVKQEAVSSNEMPGKSAGAVYESEGDHRRAENAVECCGVKQRKTDETPVVITLPSLLNKWREEFPVPRIAVERVSMSSGITDDASENGPLFDIHNQMLEDQETQEENLEDESQRLDKCSLEKDHFPADRCRTWKATGYCYTHMATRFIHCRRTCCNQFFLKIL